MTTIKNFADVDATLRPFILAMPDVKIAYTLERMERLMTLLGNPQNCLKIIHVAGTSGKTSTCYYIAALLQAAGQQVGLTVSPHLSEINERLQVSLKPLPEPAYCTVLSEFLDIIKPANIQPTFFELMIAFAYWYFAKQNLDYVVVEVGLGGLLDSTNVCTRADKVCVITDIGLDHTQILGTTLQAISRQKAGIIQPANVVVCFKQSTEVDQEIIAKIRLQRATLRAYDYQVVSNSRLPAFQQRNYQLAEHVFDYLQQRDKLPVLSVKAKQRPQQTFIPGRMEIITVGSKTIIVDGAHNPQKMATFIESLKLQYPDEPWAVLIAMKNSKDVDTTLVPVFDQAAHVIVSEFQSNYGPGQASKSAVSFNTTIANVEIIPELAIAFNTLLKRPEKLLVVTGSLYLVHQVKQLLPKKIKKISFTRLRIVK